MGELMQFVIRRARLCGRIAVVALLPGIATAQYTTEPPPVITHHQIQLESKLLSYTAEVGRIAIRDVETGEPHGYMFYTAYRVSSPKVPRPVTFIWNGGPGADSSFLHFFVAGPKRVQGGRLVDNSESWLDASDLVMVDPVGTGFSRPTKSEYGQEFYGTVGDVASVTEFIRAWRIHHAAEKAPVFLVGESWGARRAANVAYALEIRGIQVNGIVLISGGWGLNGEYVSPQLTQALRVVDMASAALYQGKAGHKGEDVQSVRREAETWVRETYAPALSHLDTLSGPERNAIIDHLSELTGLPKAQIDRKTLIITPHQFRTGLLNDENKQLYVFDLRRTSPLKETGTAAILDYLRHTLGYSTSLPYLGLEDMQQGYASSGVYPEPVNERWDYATAKVTPEELKAAMEAAAKRGDGPPRIGPPLPATEDAIAANPRMKILVAAGMYDSFLPCAEGKEIERSLRPKLRQALTFKCYLGGHAMYQDAGARTELSHDVKALIEQAR